MPVFRFIPRPSVLFPFFFSFANAGPPTVEISTNYPGTRVVVEKNEDSLIELKPDLQGGRDWFYWNFEAKALRAGEVVFRFPEKIAGFANGAVGFQGPAVSRDGGQTWNWDGSNEDFTSSREFSWKFSKGGEKVRFAVTIP